MAKKIILLITFFLNFALFVNCYAEKAVDTGRGKTGLGKPSKTPVVSLLEGQTGLISFKSVGPTSLLEFLEGRSEKKQITILGELELPSKTDDYFPAVVILHGGGGVSQGVKDWAAILRDLGLATFIIDSNSRKGCPKCYSQNEGLPNMIDAYRALELLSTHPKIDSSRIAMMGFSVGGIATLYSTHKRFQNMWAPSELEFAAYISFYPSCNHTFFEENVVTDRPIRIFHGELDELGWVVPCQEYVNQLQSVGADIDITIYPDAHHAFDRPDADKIRNFPGPNPAKCLWKEEANIGLVQFTDESEVFYERCLSIFSDNVRDCRFASMSPEFRKSFTDLFKLKEQLEQALLNSPATADNSEESVALLESEEEVKVGEAKSELDQRFAKSVKEYIKKEWGDGDYEQKIAQCLAANAEQITEKMKEAAIKYGLEKAMYKVSSKDYKSLDKIWFGLCEKGWTAETVQEEQSGGEEESGFDSDVARLEHELKYYVAEFKPHLIEGSKYFEGQEKLMAGAESCEVDGAKLEYNKDAHKQVIREVKDFFVTTFGVSQSQ